jgi:hypothetical protein
MNYRANLYYEYVEVVVQTGSTSAQIIIPVQNQLQTTPIYSICAYFPATMPLSPLSGFPLVPIANMRESFLTLNQNDPGNNMVNKNGIDLIPLSELNYINDGTSPYVWQQPMFGGQIVIWDKSFITVKTPGGLANTQPLAYVFGVRYGYPIGVQNATS